MSGIVWIVLIIYIVVKVTKQKNLNNASQEENRRPEVRPQEERMKSVKQKETPWIWGEEQAQRRKEEKNAEQKKSEQKAEQRNYKNKLEPNSKNTDIFETTERVTELDRQEAKAVIKEQKQLQKELRLEEKDYTSLVMKQLEEVMVKGPKDTIDNERDFLGEGLDMINRLM